MNWLDLLIIVLAAMAGAAGYRMGLLARAVSWFGLFAPAGTPPAVVEKIQKDIAGILREPEFKARFIDQAGHTGVGNTPAAFKAFIAADLESKRKLIAAAGIEPQ